MTDDRITQEDEGNFWRKIKAQPYEANVLDDIIWKGLEIEGDEDEDVQKREETKKTKLNVLHSVFGFR